MFDLEWLQIRVEEHKNLQQKFMHFCFIVFHKYVYVKMLKHYVFIFLQVWAKEL